MVDYGYCIPDCPYCEGTRLIAQENGDYKVCPNYWRLYWPDDIGIDQEEAEYLHFSKLSKTPALQKLSPYLKTLRSDGSGILYVYGPVGVGKTVILKSFLLWLFFQKGIRACHYTNHASMMDKLRSSFGDKVDNKLFDKRLDHYINLDLLIVDEMGRDKDTSFSLASFGKILDRRYTRAKAGTGITIFASNYTPEEILEDYIVDRLRDKKNHIVALKGESLRRSDVELIHSPEWWKELK